MRRLDPVSCARENAHAPSRRTFMMEATAASLGLGLLAGCAAPPPEAGPVDDSGLVFPPPPEQPRFFHDNTVWGSSSVTIDTSKDRFRRFATGETARGQGFAKPFSLAVKNGRLFVSDTVSRRVHGLDFPGARYFEVGRTGLGRLSKPLGIDIDDSGRIYVVDGSAQRVNVYDPNGEFITALGVAAGLERPTGMAVSPSGDRVYVVDTGGVRSSNHTVHMFDASGNSLGRIGGRGAGPGEFNLPLDCTLGPDGNLYVLDTGNFRVQVLSPDGTFLRGFGEAGRFPGQFGHPKGIALDREGKIYVSDTSFGVFQIFTNDGKILMSVGIRSESPGISKFLLPAGIAVDVDQRVYMIDQFFRKIEVYRPAGVPEDWPVGQATA